MSQGPFTTDARRNQTARVSTFGQALLEPTRSKVSKYLLQGAEPGTRPKFHIAKNTNDTLTTVTISTTPSN
jgi:hypothetical protein